MADVSLQITDNPSCSVESLFNTGTVKELLVTKTYDVESDCSVTEATNNQHRKITDVALFDDIVCVELQDSPSKDVQFVQQDVFIPEIIDISENVSYKEIAVISEKCANKSIDTGFRERIPSDDCCIISEGVTPRESTIELDDCIILDDISNKSLPSTSNKECILIDDDHDVVCEDEDVIVTENLNKLAAQMARAFLYAKADYVHGLKILYQTGFNLDSKDSRRWTLLMNACFSGSLCVVRYLLSMKVDVEKKDRRSNTAYSLAKDKGNKMILAVLRRHRKLCSLDDSQFEDFYCEDCKENFSNSSKKKHNLSIIHQSKVNSVQPHTSFHINAENVGYKMLLKCGWDGKNGLGKNSQGNKFPVLTEIKNNRLGLGHVKKSKDGKKPRLAKLKTIKRRRRKASNSQINKKSLYCEVCKEVISQSTLRMHNDSSSRHRSLIENPPKDDSFQLPTNNRGYQMLVNCGWDGKNGLGKKEQGNQFPIISQQKNNRFGLGHVKLNNTLKSTRDIIKMTAGGIKKSKYKKLKEKLIAKRLKETSTRKLYRQILM